MRFWMRKQCCSSLRQGMLFQVSLSGSGGGLILGAFLFAIRLIPLSSISSCRRQNILGITPGVGFFGNPATVWLAVWTVAYLFIHTCNHIGEGSLSRLKI